jgi:hypothetical protein
MKKKSLALLTTVTLFATLGLTVQTPAQVTQDQITTFDPPGSYNTIPTSINPNGEIAGYYFGPTGATAHGFVRNKDGTITSFDADPKNLHGISPTSINPNGEITGFFFTVGGPYGLLSHGFVRAADGIITIFDADPPVTGTYSQSINPSGEITGYFFTADLKQHGFVRAADGTITPFDVGSISTGTNPISINPAGAITGTAGGHGFVLSDSHHAGPG